MGDVVQAIASEERAKGMAVRSMFEIVSSDPHVFNRVGSYVEQLADVPPDAVRAACETLSREWTNTFSVPLPGAIRAAAKPFLDLDRRQTEAKLAADRLAHAKANCMTPERIRAELENPRYANSDPAVESRRVASLNRILASMEARQPQAKARPVRRDQGFQHVSDIYSEVL